MPLSDPLSGNYAVLTPARFTLTVEALARDDQAEADRLERSCHRLAYTHADAEFRDRMQRSCTIGLMAWRNLQKLLAVIRTSSVFKDQLQVVRQGADAAGHLRVPLRQGVRHVGGGRHRAG